MPLLYAASPQCLRRAAAALLLLLVMSSAALAQPSALLSTERAAGELPANGKLRRLNKVEAPLVQAVLDAEEIGWDLFRYELLHETAPFILGTVSGENPLEWNGCIVSREHGWRVRFYSMRGTTPQAVADVVFADGRDPAVERGQGLRPFSRKELALIRAREQVAETQSRICGDPATLIALPDRSGPGVCVYQLRAPAFSTRLPEGQHSRYAFDADGIGLLAARDFARSCSLRDSKERNKVQTYTLTHGGDPVPTELHIYLALRYKKPIFIATVDNNLFWLVDNGTVSIQH